jgi:hypothetical protein
MIAFLVRRLRTKTHTPAGWTGEAPVLKVTGVYDHEMAETSWKKVIEPREPDLKLELAVQRMTIARQLEEIKALKEAQEGCCRGPAPTGGTPEGWFGLEGLRNPNHE